MNKFRLLACAAIAVSAGALTAGPAAAYEKAHLGERAAARAPLEFDIYLPLRKKAELLKLEQSLQTSGSPQYHKWLTPKEFATRFGPSPATVRMITRELAARGLRVTQVHAHSLHVTGSVNAVERAFATNLATARFSDGRARVAATKRLAMTPMLAASGAVIPAFDSVIRMKKPSMVRAGHLPDNRSSPTGGYWFDDLKQAYSFPSYKVVNGAGVTIGILMTAGQSLVDNQAYFAHEGLPAPHISEIDLSGAPVYDPNNPFNSAEVQLDIQQSGGMAPGASIIDYNIPDLSDDAVLNGLTSIIEANKADVVNMSFGGGEIFYTAAFNGGTDFTNILVVYDDMFAQGNAEGITFTASSGDFGSNPVPALACLLGGGPGCGGFLQTAESPASSPHVVGVGGTNLVTSFTAGSLTSTYKSENAQPDPVVGDPDYGTNATGAVWASGGGTSIVYPKPLYQYLVSTGSKMRTVPDVSLHMGGCPAVAVQPCGANRSFDWVGINNSFYGFIGTSASAPDMAGLLALKIQFLHSRLGNENFAIYLLSILQTLGGPTVFRQNIPGSNGAFQTTKKGYNEVLGNGTIVGATYLGLPLTKAAGDPQTPTNP
ncbi:MAG TPA: S53 family peptidase [Alphaproteobacteria bacterium]|jgi:subtilase family serine protease|nr:S53 family peptidase [Alphaproteobacteria bacterium]